MSDGDGKGGQRRPIQRVQAVQAKLRMLAGAPPETNRDRAELGASIVDASAEAPRRRRAAQQARAFAAMPREAAPPFGGPAIDMGALEKVLGEVSLGAPPPASDTSAMAQDEGDLRVNVFVRARDPASLRALVESGVVRPDELTATRDEQLTATIAPQRVAPISDDPSVQLVEMAEHLRAPRPLASETDGAPVAAPVARVVPLADRHERGRGVLVGIVDVQGFDFSHPEFLDANGNTRFAAIWDQGAFAGRPPEGFRYGRELSRAAIDDALANERDPNGAGLPATELEPQSSMVPGSHGTHVASIAAGNLAGFCPEATLAAVLVSLPATDADRKKSFYDSTRLAHAIEYLLKVAEREGCRAVAINVSLGTNGHAHDASSATCRWIDSILAVPGRAICVAAGNAGQEAPAHPGDIGWIMGRVHTSGRVPAAGLATDIEWLVVGNGLVDVSENELELWYAPQDRFAVELIAPTGERIGPVNAGEYVQNRPLGEMAVSVYNELYHAANGANVISVYLSPDRGGILSGSWIVRVHGQDVRDGRFHGWIERDDPRPVGRLGDREAWVFPSFFAERSMVDSSTVSSLACGQRVTSVANLDEARDRINASSSQGPTRDGRFKPDVAAPGTDIVAARGFDPDRRWMKMTGTSMASPYACGVAGLMLAIEPRLTAAQLNAIIHRTSRPLPGHDYAWRDDAGFGVVHPARCVEEAASAYVRRQIA